MFLNDVQVRKVSEWRVVSSDPGRSFNLERRSPHSCPVTGCSHPSRISHLEEGATHDRHRPQCAKIETEVPESVCAAPPGTNPS